MQHSTDEVFRPALKKKPEAGWSAIRRAARIRGVPAPMLAFDMWQRRRSWNRMSFPEYFLFGLHRPTMTDAERDLFIGEACSQQFNGALLDRPTYGVFKSKIACGILLERVGLPTPPIEAIVARVPMRAAWPVFRNEATLARFLLEPGRLPLFGKPIDAKSSTGAMSLVEQVGDGDIGLGDGRVYGAIALAKAILDTYPRGYILQQMIRPHADMLALTGPVSATLRVVTLWQANGPEHLYSCLKLPAKGAMADGDQSGEVTTAGVDVPTATILRARGGSDWGGEDTTASPTTGKVLAGTVLPDMARAQELALMAHACFPQQGLVGADISLTESGPVIVELNTHPGHKLYQRAFDKPFLGEQTAGPMRRALAYAGVNLAERKLPL